MYKLMSAAIILTIALGTSTSSESRLRRSVNGFPIKIIEAPYHVQVIYEDVVSGMITDCSGSIISKDFVLTAAHCVCETKSFPKKLRDPVCIKSGNEYYPNATENCQILDVICHPGFETIKLSYDKPDDVIGINDIALIQMEKPLNFSNVQYPVPINALPIFDIHIGRTVFSTGWGANDSAAEQYPEYLLGVETEIVPIEPCLEEMKSFRVSENTMAGTFCTKPINGGFPCKGDSGGPAIMKGVQVGINSWFMDKSKEKPCDYLDDRLIAFTDVGYYLPWIRKYTEPSSIKLILGEF